MLLAAHGIISPKCWRHDPLIKNYIGETVAMIFI